MPKSLTRQQYIRRGKLLRKQMVFFELFARMRSKDRAFRKEIFIDTDFGRVRTLWYGLEAAALAPVVFDLHGGGFLLGSAGMDEEMNRELVRQDGCRIISIDYAKAPEFPYPIAVNQVYAVVRHVFEYAESYGVDQTKMAIGGHSAGGNLAAVACLQAKEAGKFQFLCQVLDYPVLDLAADPWSKPRPRGAISPQMAALFNACYIESERAKEPHASPVFANHEQLSGLPPALFILAGGDSLHDEGLQYCRMLQEAGVETECQEYPGAPHGFTYSRSPDSLAARNRMAEFLCRYLES